MLLIKIKYMRYHISLKLILLGFLKNKTELVNSLYCYVIDNDRGLNIL